MPIVDRAAGLHAEVASWRRDFHAHPELLFDVHRTAASVAEIVQETISATLTERGATRMDDQTSEASMERRKKEGYF